MWYSVGKSSQKRENSMAFHAWNGKIGEIRNNRNVPVDWQRNRASINMNVHDGHFAGVSPLTEGNKIASFQGFPTEGCLLCNHLQGSNTKAKAAEHDSQISNKDNCDVVIRINCMEMWTAIF